MYIDNCTALYVFVAVENHAKEAESKARWVMVSVLDCCQNVTIVVKLMALQIKL